MGFWSFLIVHRKQRSRAGQVDSLLSVDRNLAHIAESAISQGDFDVFAKLSAHRSLVILRTPPRYVVMVERKPNEQSVYITAVYPPNGDPRSEARSIAELHQIEG